MSASLNSPISVLMHRLEVASHQLDMVVAHYSDPNAFDHDDIGAITVTRAVAQEVTSLYCGFSEYLVDNRVVDKGPWVDRFPEDLPEASEEETELPDSDHTGPRIHAYLASVRPFRGSGSISDQPEFQRGRSLIEQMAIATPGIDTPSLKLPPGKCADILYFISHVEPVEPQSWWEDPKYGPSHLVGYTLVLEALQANLRRFEKTVAAVRGAQS